MAEFKHKKGDFVRLTKYEDDGAPNPDQWERLRAAYGLYPDTMYEIVDFTAHNPIIQSADPNRPITYTFKGVVGRIDWEDRFMERDDDYLNNKLKELFG